MSVSPSTFIWTALNHNRRHLKASLDSQRAKNTELSRAEGGDCGKKESRESEVIALTFRLG